MQGSGQPHGGAASSALRTPLLLAELFLGRSRLTFLPKGASAARHHPSACQQHGLERCSELGREWGSCATAPAWGNSPLVNVPCRWVSLGAFCQDRGARAINLPREQGQESPFLQGAPPRTHRGLLVVSALCCSRFLSRNRVGGSVLVPPQQKGT